MVFKALVDGAPERVRRMYKSKINRTHVGSRDKYAVVGYISMLLANFYRRASGTMLKGEGCFHDLIHYIEVAHANTILTRDEEFFECFKLVKTAVKDARPEILLVPQP